MVLVVSAPQIRFLERSLLWEKSRIFIPREKRRCCPTLASRTSGSLTRSSPLPSEVKIGRGGRLVQCCERSSGGCFRRRRSDGTGEDKRTMTDDFKRRRARQHVTIAVSAGKCPKSSSLVLGLNVPDGCTDLCCVQKQQAATAGAGRAGSIRPQRVTSV